MRSLKRLGSAFFATSMLCTINVANAKIFVGTNHVAESVNLIDKDLIESQNNELIAGKKKKKKTKKKRNIKDVKVILDGKEILFLYKPKKQNLEVFENGMSICIFRGPEVLPPVLKVKVMSCLKSKASIRDKKAINNAFMRKILNQLF